MEVHLLAIIISLAIVQSLLRMSCEKRILSTQQVGKGQKFSKSITQGIWLHTHYKRLLLGL